MEYIYKEMDILGKVDFGKTKDKIATVENAKQEKRSEMRALYDNLVQNEEVLDILMIQIGKDIEEKFPGVKFRLISRIKTEKSFTDKLENDLAGLVDIKKIEEVNIYDIIALSIIVEKVPGEVITNDPSFDSHISELLDIRHETKTYLKMHIEKVEEYKQRIEILKRKIEEKKAYKDKTEKKIKNITANGKDEFEIIELLQTISLSLGSAIEDMQEQIGNIEKDIDDMNIIIARTKDRYDKENNECNHAVADFIIRNISKFDNVRTIGLTDIPKRLKQKENYDGYRATHNCYSLEMTMKDDNGHDKDVTFICEIQGKSIDAYYVADRGKAARYHTGQTEQPGKIVKRKRLPHVNEAQTQEEIEALRREVEKTVPRFRIFRHTTKSDENGKIIVNSPEIYTLSQKECFMLYYYNQLFGNRKLDIKPQKEILSDAVTSHKLDETNYRLYKNYNYTDLIER